LFIRFFKTNQPAAYIAVTLTGVALWSFSLLKPIPLDLPAGMPLYDLLLFPFANFKSLFIIFAFIMVLFQAFYLESIINSNDLRVKNSHLPSLFYLIIASSMPSFLTLNPVMLANLPLLFTVHLLFSSYRKDEAFSDVFDAGFLVAIASLIYFPAIVFLPMIWIALILLRPFIWREWVISLLGFLVPYIFALSYFFWFDRLGWFVYEKLFRLFFVSFLHSAIPHAYYYYIAIIIPLLIFSLLEHFRLMQTGQIRIQKYLLLILWFFFFSIGSYLLAPSWSFNHFTLLAIPVSVFFGNYFLSINRNWIAEILFLLLLATILYGQFKCL